MTDAFPLPFTDAILDAVAGHEIYSFLGGFVRFVTEWELCVVVVIMFGLKTTPAKLQRVIQEIFNDYILAFMQVFLDDFVFYSR